MVGAEPVTHGGLVYDFDWSTYSHIVDVGGGLGGAAVELLRRFPSMHITLQDQANVLDKAPDFWQERAAEHRHRVTFSPHDFFGPQTVCSSAYFLRLVLHDWEDKDAVRILKPLRDALEVFGPEARLFIAETVIRPATPRFTHQIDMQMLTLLGAYERTESQFQDILSQSAFAIKCIHSNRGILSLIEAVLV